MVFGLLVLLAAAPPARPFNEERHLLDRRLETLRRILPDVPNPVADQALLKDLAEQARLGSIEVQPRAPLESGSRGDVAVEVSAVGRFGDIDRFFRQVALSHRLLDVQSLSLTASQEDVIRLKATVQVPYRPSGAPLPPPPDGMRSHLGGVPKPAAEAFLRDQALALAKTEAIASLRRARRNPRLFLSETAAVVRDRPVVLNYAALAEEFVIRGLAVGEGPVRSLESRLERGFFRVSEFLMARQGACHRFEIRGKAPVAGVDAELPLPSDDPFEQDDSPCRVDRDQGRSLIVKGPTAKVPSKGPLSLRLRDVDLADAFRVLHILTGQAFVVDGNVTGRASLDLSHLTLEETLAAFRKAGLDISEPGPVRRVSMGRGVVTMPPPSTGGTPTASFALKRAEVREILAVMTDIDAGLAALGPQGSLGRLSVWAKDLSLADLRVAILDTAGLAERFEEGRRILERSPGSADALVPVAGTPPDRRLALRPEDLAVLEFELAALASADGGWLACAYSPTGALNAYRPGDRLADGIVKAVEPTDVVIETDDGPLRIPIAPMPR